MLNAILDRKIAQEKLQEKFKKELLDEMEHCHVALMERFQQQRHSYSSATQASDEAEQGHGNSSGPFESEESEFAEMYRIPPAPAVTADISTNRLQTSRFEASLPATQTYSSSPISSRNALSGSVSMSRLVAPSSMTNYSELSVSQSGRRTQQSAPEGVSVPMLSSQLTYINGTTDSSVRPLQLGYIATTAPELDFEWNNLLNEGQGQESEVPAFRPFNQLTYGVNEMQRHSSQGWPSYTQSFTPTRCDDNERVPNAVYTTSSPYGSYWNAVPPEPHLNQYVSDQRERGRKEKEKLPQIPASKKRKHS
jgi:hypothetical protein